MSGDIEELMRRQVLEVSFQGMRDGIERRLVSEFLKAPDVFKYTFIFLLLRLTGSAHCVRAGNSWFTYVGSLRAFSRGSSILGIYSHVEVVIHVYPEDIELALRLDAIYNQLRGRIDGVYPLRCK